MRVGAARGGALGVLLALLLTAGSTRADRGDCDQEFHTWLASCAARRGLVMTPTFCPPGLLVVEASVPGGAPLKVEIQHGAPRAFRTAGGYGLSPVGEFPRWDDVDPPRRRALDELGACLTERASIGAPAPAPGQPPRASPPEAPPQRAAGSTLALLAAALVLALAGRSGAWRSAQGEPLGRAAALAFLLAGALRVGLGPFGPLHVNGQGPQWLLGALQDPRRLLPYGPGYPEILGLVGRLAPARGDDAIFLANALFSALAAPLALLLGAALGLERRRAVLVALIVACDPVSLRAGATEAYFPLIVALTLGAAVLLARAALAGVAGRVLPAAQAALAATLLGAVAARVHPVAWGPAGLATAFALAAALEATPRDARGARRWPRPLIVAAAVGLPYLACLAWLSLGSAQAGGVGRLWTPERGLALLLDTRAPVWGPALLALGLGLATARPRAALLPGAVGLLALGATRLIYGQSDLWRDSYDRLWLVAPWLAGVALVPARVARWRWAPAVAGAALLGWVWSGRATLVERTTEHHEYRFFREQLRAVPAGCRLAYVPRRERRLVGLPENALPASPEPERSVVHLEAAAELIALRRHAGCLYFARTSLCSSAEGRPVCDALLGALTLTPVAQAAFPARPSYDELPYDRDPVEVGLYVVEPSAAR